mgnify:CR=1 FL=1
MQLKKDYVEIVGLNLKSANELKALKNLLNTVQFSIIYILDFSQADFLIFLNKSNVFQIEFYLQQLIDFFVFYLRSVYLI